MVNKCESFDQISFLSRKVLLRVISRGENAPSNEIRFDPSRPTSALLLSTGVLILTISSLSREVFGSEKGKFVKLQTR